MRGPGEEFFFTSLHFFLNKEGGPFSAGGEAGLDVQSWMAKLAVEEAMLLMEEQESK